jgi:hypothetical protein
VRVRREVPDFFIIDYKNWSLLRQILDENLNLDISLDRMGSKLDLNVMVNTITSVMVEARSRSVPVVRPTRFALTLTPHIKSIIRLKNSQRHRARLTRNSRAMKRSKALFNMLNRLVKFLISGLAASLSSLSLN